ncbi:MAG TPA: GntR family transcriptional regulator [Quisquiliibacterium sp.]|nr:GntR family transcriptional regulator [Quisquiliibacterium sp.]
MTDPRHVPPSAGPRYQQVADALARDIARGLYEVGSLLPTEAQLCTLFNVSRHTVREATRRLVDVGLISRQAGVGTRVKARTSAARYTASLGSLSELVEYIHSTRLALLSAGSVAADARLAETLHCRRGQRWFQLRTLRYPVGRSEPIAYTEIHVPPQFRDIEQDIDGGTVSILRQIELRSGERVVEVLQEIGACAIPAPQARLLGVAPRSPGLQVLRTYRGAGERTLCASLIVSPAHRFTLSTRWRLEQGAPIGPHAPADRASPAPA